LAIEGSCEDLKENYKKKYCKSVLVRDAIQSQHGKAHSVVRPTAQTPMDSLTAATTRRSTPRFTRMATRRMATRRMTTRRMTTRRTTTRRTTTRRKRSLKRFAIYPTLVSPSLPFASTRYSRLERIVTLLLNPGNTKTVNIQTINGLSLRNRIGLYSRDTGRHGQWNGRGRIGMDLVQCTLATSFINQSSPRKRGCLCTLIVAAP
jgi:hypothetical protein